MRLHSVTYPVTNSSTETYHFPRYAGLSDLFNEMLEGLWHEWVRLNPEPARNWALGEAYNQYPEPSYDDAQADADRRLRYCPLHAYAGEDGVPSIHVTMTGSDSPQEFDEILLAVLGGKREAW